MIERLWRSVKHEEVFLSAYENASQARWHLIRYFAHYNRERPHQALGGRTPDELYYAA